MRCNFWKWPSLKSSDGVLSYLCFLWVLFPDDILWFKPVEMRTKWGRRGHIKEALGECWVAMSGEPSPSQMQQSQYRSMVTFATSGNNRSFTRSQLYSASTMEALLCVITSSAKPLKRWSFIQGCKLPVHDHILHLSFKCWSPDKWVTLTASIEGNEAS